MTVELAIVPHEQIHPVVIGTSLRKSKAILEAYLQGLAWQILPKNVQPFYCFVDDGLEPDAKAVVEEFLSTRQGVLRPSGQVPTTDFLDAHPVTHQWSNDAMNRVGANKDWILGVARYNRAEAVWFCDSDLICDPMTFSTLWHNPEQIVCAVYWTRWEKVPSEAHPVHAGPQVWQGHPYTLAGNGMNEWELRRKLIERQVVHVYGQGACTLIRQAALLKGVSFAPVPGNTGAGLMQGEDRHFCIRAEQMHIKMVADGWPDIFHIYHRPEDEALIPEMSARLSERVGGRCACRYTHCGCDAEEVGRIPVVGDLVSLELCALEPVPTHQGMAYPPVQQVRGRLGKIPLHPELESVVLDMERGEVRVVPVHFGLDYPFPPHQGQRKLIRVTLLDHKPMGFQPVIDQEIIQNEVSTWVDSITFTPSALTLMQEVHDDGGT